MNAHIKGTRQEQELRGRDTVVGAHFEGTRQGQELRGRDMVVGANFQGARNQVRVQDDGEGRNADADDGAAAAAERHHRQFRVMPLRLYLIIPKSMTETALREQFGALEYVSVVKDKVTGTSRGFGYVKFFQFSHAAKALTGCDPNYKPKFANPWPRWVDRRAHYGGSTETKQADLRTNPVRGRRLGREMLCLPYAGF